MTGGQIADKSLALNFSAKSKKMTSYPRRRVSRGFNKKNKLE